MRLCVSVQCMRQCPAPLPEGGIATCGKLSAPLPEGGIATCGKLSAPLPEGDIATRGKLSAPLPEGGIATCGKLSAPLPKGGWHGASHASAVTGGFRSSYQVALLVSPRPSLRTGAPPFRQGGQEREKCLRTGAPHSEAVTSTSSAPSGHLPLKGKARAREMLAHRGTPLRGGDLHLIRPFGAPSPQGEGKGGIVLKGMAGGRGLTAVQIFPVPDSRKTERSIVRGNAL